MQKYKVVNNVDFSYSEYIFEGTGYFIDNLGYLYILDDKFENNELQLPTKATFAPNKWSFITRLEAE